MELRAELADAGRVGEMQYTGDKKDERPQGMVCVSSPAGRSEGPLLSLFAPVSCVPMPFLHHTFD